MKSFAISLAVVFLASVTLATYGHCWPPVAQTDAAGHDHAHDGDAHRGAGDAGDCAGAMVAPMLAAAQASVATGPVKKAAAPASIPTIGRTPSLTDTMVARTRDRSTGPPLRFADIHARTGRLLI